PCSGNSTTAVNDGQWHQLVATYNATGGVASIYVDGHLEAASSGTVLNPVSGVHFMVGGIFGVTYQPQATYTGLIDNVAVWDNALSESDVHALYASETSAATPEPGSIVMMLGGALAIAPFLRRRN
ncbi:MAG TPA: LamG-like jellyroll fold domain-containing protein, partial [Bryobacteraceae bacterium]|nr:LamG-like jellyroll fold domain-containing protein [Bryobacteraceae bacterium]